MINVTSMVDTVGDTGIKGLMAITNGTLVDGTVTMNVQQNVLQWIIVGLVIYILYKLTLGR